MSVVKIQFHVPQIYIVKNLNTHGQISTQTFMSFSVYNCRTLEIGFTLRVQG